MTVRVIGGDSGQWSGIQRVWIDGPGGNRFHDVESCRPYADRLILKLRGINDANGAASLRGGNIGIPVAEAPALDDGTYYAATLIGMSVQDESGTDLGRVDEVLPTGGTDVLVVNQNGAAEVMIPLANGIIQSIDEATRCILVRLPEGLLEVNVHPAAAAEGGAS